MCFYNAYLALDVYLDRFFYISLLHLVPGGFKMSGFDFLEKRTQIRYKGEC